MRFGVTLFLTDRSIAPDEIAREAEARGFDSLYLPEHTHIPVSRRTPPPTGDAELAEEYRRTLDPFIALMAAGAATERLRLGTGIALTAQREPIVTAKVIATLDLLTGGRVALGVGFGWNEDELEHHGVTMRERRAVSREHVLAMKALWTEDQASFHGEHVDLEPSWAWPKPVQPGGPPVLLGGSPGPKLFAHIAEYCDGWIPIGAAGVGAALDDLRRAMEAQGRDISTLEIVPFGSIPTPEKLAYFEEIGVTECVFRLPSAGRDDVLPVLDRWTPFIER